MFLSLLVSRHNQTAFSKRREGKIGQKLEDQLSFFVAQRKDCEQASEAVHAKTRNRLPGPRGLRQACLWGHQVEECVSPQIIEALREGGLGLACMWFLLAKAFLVFVSFLIYSENKSAYHMQHYLMLTSGVYT